MLSLRRSVELVQATADELPLFVVPGGGKPITTLLLDRHMAAMCDYTAALSCVHALLAEYGTSIPERRPGC